jgi:hypothetical protein
VFGRRLKQFRVSRFEFHEKVASRN